MTITRLKTTPRLRSVSEEQPVDITLALRADILKRDWNSVMVNGDRSKSVDIPERKGGWR